MNRIGGFMYGALAYAAFFLVFLYLMGFVGNIVVFKSIDSGLAAPIGEAIFIDAMLVALFGVQHSIMARPAFKSWWTRLVPKPLERSTYVLLASLILALLFWQWRPIPTTIWDAEEPILRVALTGLFFAGWGLALFSSCLIDHFDLFGLRQVYLHLRNRPYAHPPFVVRSLYRVVRHPLMVGFLIALWATPTMTAGHLLFAALLTGYILIGVRLEERDLTGFLGPEYVAYRSETPMFIPRSRRKPPVAPELGRTNTGSSSRAHGC
jgi:protein-S-isoprenylcysteine O-methyltransferase Ste14